MWNAMKQLQGLCLIAALASSVLANAAAQAAPATKSSSSAKPATAAVKPVSINPYARHTGPPRRQRLFYDVGWGVDGMSAKSVESGQLIRFSYHVLDAQKAATLNDDKLTPYLVDERSHAKLVIPSLEKVGQLRNKNAAETGKSYWMAFSNKGGYVKKGDIVTVVIGKFRATGLVVQ
jgi:hypothetical protein